MDPKIKQEFFIPKDEKEYYKYFIPYGRVDYYFLLNNDGNNNVVNRHYFYLHWDHYY